MWRSGLTGDAVHRYTGDWIAGISDVTASAAEIHRLVKAGDVAAAGAMLPVERPYPVPADGRARGRAELSARIRR